MDAFEILRMKARQRRDAAMSQIRAEHRKTMAEIDKMAIKLSEKQVRRYKYPPQVAMTKHDSMANLPAAKVAQLILIETGRAMKIPELVLEVQRRGCRAKDCPRAVANSIHSSFYYHQGVRLKKDAEGRWSVISGNGAPDM